jgi:hypothetical protein
VHGRLQARVVHALAGSALVHAVAEGGTDSAAAERLAATMLQAAWRSYKCRKDLKRQHAAAIAIQVRVQ